MNPWVRRLLAALVLAFLFATMVAPVLRLALQGGQIPLDLVWQDAHLRWRVGWTLLQAVLTCALTLVLGLPVAWVLARFDFALRGATVHALMLPLVVPTLVAAMGILSLADAWPRAHGMSDEGPWWLLYGNLFFNLCLMVRATMQALEQVSASRLAAARTLGASPWRAFWRVEWPAVAPVVLGAQCMIFLYCCTGFGLALVLGGQRFATVEVEIYTLVAHELDLGTASALALCSLLLMGLVTLAHAGLALRLASERRSDAVPRMPPRTRGHWLSIGAAMGVLFLACWAPLIALLARVLLAGASAWSVLAQAETWGALANSLGFSALAVLLATTLGLAHALAARRSVLLRALAYLPLVLSPISVAFGLLLLYPRWSASLGVLIGAYALLAYPFVAQALTTALDAMPAQWNQAARTLGATPWRAFWRVTWPALQPALRRGMAFAAATAVGEFAVTLFLSRPEWATLSTLVYTLLGRPGAANRDAALVLSALLMGLALLAFVLIERRVAPDPTAQGHGVVRA